MAVAFLRGLGQAILPSLISEGTKVLGDFGTSFLGKMGGGGALAATAGKIGRYAVGGLENYIKQSVNKFGAPTPYDKFRKAGGQPNSTDYPVQPRRTQGRRRPINVRGYDNVEGDDDDLIAASRPQKRRQLNNSIPRYRTEADFFNEEE